MTTSGRGISLIRFFEGINDDDLSIIGYQPKMDPVFVWTAGIGHAIIYDGVFLKGIENKALAYSLYPNMTEEDANELLKVDVSIFERKLNRLNIPLEQNQFDSLISFCFNLGFGAFLNSTLRKRVINGGNIESAFLMWNKAGGKVLRGLTLRRQAEADLYLKNELILP